MNRTFLTHLASLAFASLLLCLLWVLSAPIPLKFSGQESAVHKPVYRALGHRTAHGAKVATATANDGIYTDNIRTGVGTYTYYLISNGVPSNPATVTFQ